METLLGWVRHLVLLVIVVSFLELLVPKNALQPYVRLVAGLVILAAVVAPLLSLARGDDLWGRVSLLGERVALPEDRLAPAPALGETERRLRNDLLAAGLAAYLEQELGKTAGGRVKVAVRVEGEGRVERLTLAAPAGRAAEVRRRAAALTGVDPAQIKVVEEAVP